MEKTYASTPFMKPEDSQSSDYSELNSNSSEFGSRPVKKTNLSRKKAGKGNIFACSAPLGIYLKQHQDPINVEPKVFFANERTFLAWLHESVVLFSASIAILALSRENFSSVMFGLLLLPIAVAFLVYAVVQYMRRAAMIRNLDPGPYDDMAGPIILGVMLMLSIIIQVTLKLYSIVSKIDTN